MYMESRQSCPMQPCPCSCSHAVQPYACNGGADFLRPGTNDPMPGLIGKAYAEMGGTVHYVGKPLHAVYEACFEALQVNLSLDFCQRVRMVSAEQLSHCIYPVMNAYLVLFNRNRSCWIIVGLLSPKMALNSFCRLPRLVYYFLCCVLLSATVKLM